MEGKYRCIGKVNPWKDAEHLITGQTIDETLADEAAKKAPADARPLSQNACKIEIAAVPW